MSQPYIKQSQLDPTIGFGGGSPLTDDHPTPFTVTGTGSPLPTIELSVVGNDGQIATTQGSLIIEGEVVGTTATAYALKDEAATPTNPTLVPSRTDSGTGIGWSGAHRLSLVAGSIEAMCFISAGSPKDRIQFATEADVGLTADAGSSQGDGVIASSYNVYSTVGTTGDAATLPAVFQVGTQIHIKNDGANSMDVFPASGDNAGAGTDTAVAVGAGAYALFLATVASSTWTQLI